VALHHPRATRTSFRFGAAVDSYTELPTSASSSQETQKKSVSSSDAIKTLDSGHSPKAHKSAVTLNARTPAAPVEPHTTAADVQRAHDGVRAVALVEDKHLEVAPSRVAHVEEDTIGKTATIPEAPDDVPIVHVWSKASIGDYLWHHVLGGNATRRDGGLWRDGNITIRDTGVGDRLIRGMNHNSSAHSSDVVRAKARGAQLWFRSGWSVQSGDALRSLKPKYLVLVLNGHEPNLAHTAQVRSPHVSDYPRDLTQCVHARAHTPTQIICAHLRLFRPPVHMHRHTHIHTYTHTHTSSRSHIGPPRPGLA
jgi:hypothetical protein